MNIHIFTSPGCGYCVKVKEVMRRAELQYSETVIGTDMTKEEYRSTYPNHSNGFPFVLIDENPVGGLTDTVKFLYEKGLIQHSKK